MLEEFVRLLHNATPL